MNKRINRLLEGIRAELDESAEDKLNPVQKAALDYIRREGSISARDAVVIPGTHRKISKATVNKLIKLGLVKLKQLGHFGSYINYWIPVGDGKDRWGNPWAKT